MKPKNKKTNFLHPSNPKIILSIILFILLFSVAGVPVIDYIMCEPCLLGEDCFPCTNDITLITIKHFLGGIIGGEINLPLLAGLIVVELFIGYLIACLVIFEYRKYIKKKN